MPNVNCRQFFLSVARHSSEFVEQKWSSPAAAAAAQLGRSQNARGRMTKDEERPADDTLSRTGEQAGARQATVTKRKVTMINDGSLERTDFNLTCLPEEDQN